MPMRRTRTSNKGAPNLDLDEEDDEHDGDQLALNCNPIQYVGSPTHAALNNCVGTLKQKGLSQNG